ncbi:MAG: response regulator [Eubacteriales bacterium]|nr:response regulator [Eubacteriales bacterium]
MNLLIVDDEPKIRNGLEKLINSRPEWQVAGAFETAAEALEYLEQYPVDVLVTDIRMPGLSGLDLIQQIRDANRDIRIIILSGYSEFSYAQRAIQLGVMRYLTKPTSPRELFGVLEEAQSELEQMQATEEKVMDAEKSNLMIEEAIAYIEKNYSKKITLRSISDALYISPNYLCRLFKQHTGKNLMEYVTNYRMDMAKSFLKDVHYKVSQVAELAGYHDTRYFSSSFKKYTGMTPLEYRNTKDTKN